MTSLQKEVSQERLDWFIRLRWAAVAGGAVILVLGPWLFPLDIRYSRLYPCLALLGALNLGYFFRSRWIRSSAPDKDRQALLLLHFQMVADLFLLTLMLYLSGGAENPLILLYLFHLAISAMVFSTAESLLYAGAALGLPWLLFLLEDRGPGWTSLWEGAAGLSRVHERSNLAAYSAAAAGLWFFLSRLALDLKERERALRETGESLRKAKEELERLGETKAHFLRQVVFQLKGPAIDLDFDLSLIDRALPKRGSQAQEAVVSGKGKVRTLLELIEDLTWLSRLGEGAFRPESFNMYEAVLGRVQVLEEGARKKGIEFQVHGDPGTRLSADKEAFVRVVDDLLSNAVKYSPPGGRPVLLEIKAEEPWMVLAVQDEGIGIPPKQQKRVFEEFFRASNAKAREGAGTGLGLAIVKRVLALHGGRVEFTSSQEGTRVETRWPVLPPAPVDPG